MEVTVRDMDVTVEHTWMCLLRVTGMKVLNHYLQLLESHKVQVVIENKLAINGSISNGSIGNYGLR
ncbi:hypothetical protein CBX96_11860 [Shewanella sp. BC20]|nr:hypothetical protein CBX96_11860 [Shewanella sp. BC20]